MVKHSIQIKKNLLTRGNFCPNPAEQMPQSSGYSHRLCLEISIEPSKQEWKNFKIQFSIVSQIDAERRLDTLPHLGHLKKGVIIIISKQVNLSEYKKWKGIFE